MKIEIKNYTKEIQKNIVLNNISLTLSNDEGGRVYGLQGINGSGKTMLMRAICGLILPTEGYVAINSKKIGEEISFPPNTGLLIENPAFINEFTGFKNLKLVAEIRNKIAAESIENAISAVGLDPKDRRTFRKYSLGMKQRLGIAAAIMEDPELVILDEPFNALDTDGVSLISNIIMNLKERGKLIILACHDRTLLETVADEIVPMENGQIISARS